LQNYVSVSRYDFDGVRGFGLLQRDRREEHYRDDEAKYHLRPSVWIEPRAPWPAGAVELLEMPAPHEGIDNVAAWWTPRATPDFDQPLELAYTVTFRTSEPPAHTLARAVATRVMREKGQSTRIEIDFAGEPLSNLADDAIAPRVACQRGRVSEFRLERHSPSTMQLSFRVAPAGSAPVELQAELCHGEKSLTETWRYLCPTIHD
jgi:glucans biosynthesis protein